MIKIYTKIWAVLTRQEKRQGLWLGLLMILSALLEVVGIGSVMPFLSVVGNPESIHQNAYLSAVYHYLGDIGTNLFMVLLGLGALLMLLISTCVRSLTEYVKLNFANMRRHYFSQSLLKRYQHQPYDFFLSRNSNNISQVILSETDLAIQQAILPALDLVASTIMTLFILGFLIAVDPILSGLLIICFGGFYGGIYLVVKNYLTRIGVKRSSLNNQRFKTIAESIGGIKELKILGRQSEYLDKFDQASYGFCRYMAIQPAISQIPQYVAELVIFGSMIGIALYALILQEGQINTLLPLLGVFGMGSVKLKPAMQKVYTALTTMKFGASALDNINQDLVHLKEHEIIYHDHSRLHLHEHLQLVNVHFTYDGADTHALNNLNLTIGVNTMVGIMGSTGAGKSTFVDLILGLLQPDSGSVLVDNTRLNQNNIRQWQNSIGYVPQEIFLADDTVSNNIAFGVASEDIDANQVEKAARMAQIHDFILTLQHGYQTMIGERGVRLSGGQKQRLAIARALYHDPDLLILDEATSALDNYTEKEVMKAIDHMSGTRTIIMIAHRLTTLANCDKVILLDNGQISKIGQYEDLVTGVK